MKRRLIRSLSLMLCCLMLASAFLTVFCLPSAAAQGERRFIFSSLLNEDGAVCPSGANGALTLALSEENLSFSATDLSPMADRGQNNALYISLINRSDAGELTVRYQQLDNNVPKTHVIRQNLIKASDEEQSFLLHAPSISDDLTTLSISFSEDGGSGGSVELLSFFDVSVYESAQAGEATVKSFFFNEESHTLEIGGELSYAATVRYAGETLALFRLSPGEDLYLSPSKTPVARMGVSFDFSFSVPVESADQLYARYVVAAVTKAGERVPLSAPLYPDISYDRTQKEVGFKGYHTESLYTVLDSGAGTEIVDVYLDRLQNTQNNGILYAGDRSYYYFDQDYVNELDRRVRNLSGVGCTVYLRFLISPDANGFPFVAYTKDATGIVNKGISITDDEGLLSIHAFTDFLTARYAGGAQGRIDGVILGRRADRASTYGYVEPMVLSDYAELYATALQVVSGAGRKHIPDLKMVVPISDHTWSKTVSTERLMGDYFSDLFLISLLEVVSSTMITPLSFTLMMESDATPDILTGEAGATYGIDRLSTFMETLEQYSVFYDFLDTHILYLWTPDGALSYQELCAAYALQYISLFQNAAVDSFIVDFSLLEARGERAAARDLLHLATYIDTPQSKSVTDPLLRVIGVGSFSELFQGYDAAALAKRRVIREELLLGGYHNAPAITGRYELWNFAATTSVLGWYAGSACNALSVLSRALSAELAPTKDGEFAELAYHFNAPKNLREAPLFRLNLGIDGADGTPYEVQVRLLGENTTAIASTVLYTGEERELFLDLSQYAAELGEIRGVRLLARPLSASDENYRLRLGSMTVESTVLSNEQLAEMMADDTFDGDEDEGKNDYATPILVSVLVGLVSIALIVFLIIRRYAMPQRGEKRRAEGKAENTKEE